jgi:hypothetical protein
MPKQVWEILHPALLHRQELEIFAPLLHWLQAASVGTAMVHPLVMGAPQIMIVNSAFVGSTIVVGFLLFLLMFWHFKIFGLNE